MTGPPNSARSSRFRLVHDVALKVAHARGLRDGDADDVAQETALAYAATPQEPDDLRAWAGAVAARKVADVRRAGYRHPVTGLPSLEHREERIADALRRVALPASQEVVYRDLARRLLDRLSPRETAVLELDLAGYDYTEIADLLDYAGPDSVKTTVYRIRRKIASYIGTNGRPDWYGEQRVY